MSPRLGFVVSLLAACGIHAVVLLVPRAATVGEASIPTIVLDLSATPAAVEGALVPATRAKLRAAGTRSDEEHPAPPPDPLEPSAVAPSAARSESSAQAEPIAGNAPSATASTGSQQGDGEGATPAAQPAAARAAAAPALIPPHPRSEILATYPRSARRSGLEGVVRVSAVVDDSGVVTSAEVSATSGHAALDQAALEAVRRALFAPARQGDKPVPCSIVIPIRFQLSAAVRE